MISPFKKAGLPPFPGLLKALGPGIIWMALAQGSSELIWWPYLIAKYGLAFLFLLLPACLLQYPVNHEIGRYTLATGETIFQGFARVSRPLALVLFFLMVLSFLWFGAFASAGGTALASLTGFPHGWSTRGQTLFWGYASIAVFLFALLVSKSVYRLIEKLMWGVALITVIGLVAACLDPAVTSRIPEFLKGLTVSSWPAGRPWDPADATKVLTAIAFAGLGGFWTLFYSYWIKEKGVGMAADPAVPSDSETDRLRWKQWSRFLRIDSGVGIFGNILTTLMTCLLAYALLFPHGILPEEYQIAVVQSRFFEVSWGVAGKILFLFVAAAFLADTWLATIDAVSRVYTDCVIHFFPKTKQWPERTLYRFFLILLTFVTCATMPLAQPGPLILLSAVIGFVGTILFTGALLLVNRRLLPSLLPKFARPGWGSFVGLMVSWGAYLALAIAYFWAVS